MKKTIYILTLLCAATSIQAQVGIGTTTPDASSILDATSTSKGLLAPRMTTAQRDAITSPATGLQIYNTDNAALETFTGTTGEWFTLGRGNGAVTYNTAVGVYALQNNTTGNYNTANGYEALASNTIGYNNTANGNWALWANTTGYYNTANGYEALTYNTTGHHNTANGNYALNANTTGVYNTANGAQALQNNTTGVNNTANGNWALWSNTTGNYNTANGVSALQANTTGDYNTANGNWALFSNTTGSSNTANGIEALYTNTTGNYNTAIGRRALQSNTTGYSNTANGNNALEYNTTGYYNTANGRAALYSNTTGGYNTAIGNYANVSYSNLTNATAIGNNATVTASNRVRIGNGSVGRIGGQVGWSTLSDGRIKENVQEAVPGLSFIAELRPVTYTLNTRKQDAINMQAMPDSIQEERMLSDADYLASSSIVRTGFIAQEVEAAAQKVGFDFDGVSTPQNETDLYSIRYAEFVVPLVKAMQEQQAIITQLKETAQSQQAKIEGQETKIDGQETKIDGQQATITELKATAESQQAKIDQQKNDYLLLLKRIEALEN
jgi:hypothetical protein